VGSSPGPLFEVLCEQPHRFLVELRGPARSLPRFEGAALVELLAVALVTVARSTPKRRAVSLFGTPFFTDSTIFALRSIEYAFMFPPYPAQHHRNPL
jgi:hypothetical protein